MIVSNVYVGYTPGIRESFFPVLSQCSPVLRFLTFLQHVNTYVVPTKWDQHMQ